MMRRMFLFSVALLSAVPAAATYDIDAIIKAKAAENGLDENLVRAVIKVESNGRINARSHKDARGLMQVIPPTAKRMGVNPSYLYMPEHNITAGTRYLAYLNRMFSGNLDYILAGYNAGEGAVQKFGGIPPYRETRDYVVKVRNRYLALNNGTAPAQSYSAAPSDAVRMYRAWVDSVPETERARPERKSEPVKVAVKRPAKPLPEVKIKADGFARADAEAGQKHAHRSFVQTLDENGNFVNL